MFTFEEGVIPDVYKITLPRIVDGRGAFTKVLHAPSYLNFCLRADFAESYYSTSRRGVVRGMHLQLPPLAHCKIVYCVAGAVRDVLIDLRVGSPTYGKWEDYQIDSEVPTALYIPEGIAHGFCALSESATLVYLTTSIHDPALDAGVRWDSFGYEWPVVSAPIISERDRSLQTLMSFTSPFDYKARD